MRTFLRKWGWPNACDYCIFYKKNECAGRLFRPIFVNQRQKGSSFVPAGSLEDYKPHAWRGVLFFTL
jgi:hypothetical protein